MENWSDIEFIFAKNLNITPLELRSLPFYEIEMLKQSYEKWIEEEKKRQKQQEKDQQKTYSKQTQQQRYKNPSFGKGGNDSGEFSVPKVKIPKVNVPKL